MKKILFIFIALSALLVSCDVVTSIKDYDKNKLNVTVYANDTEIKGGFSFTASEAWSTFVEYNNNNEGWITIDPAGGGAGQVTMNILLEENNSGEARTATIHIVCGNSNLNIAVEQKSTENTGDDNGENNDDNGEDNGDNGGNEPTQKAQSQFITRIKQVLEDKGQTTELTYTFRRNDNSNPFEPITLVRIDGLPREDGAATVYDNFIEYRIAYDRNDIYIETYANEYLYKTTHAKISGKYIDELSYTETIQVEDVFGNETSDVYDGIETHTFYFNRNSHNNQLYRSDYVYQAVFEGNEVLNQRQETSYYFEWEDAINSSASTDYFNHPYNNTRLHWHAQGWENSNEYMTYNPDLNMSNIYSNDLIAEGIGCYVDINYLISLYWLAGPSEAYGEDIIFGLIGLITPPSYNLISKLSYSYNQWDGNDVYVDYTLNKDGYVESFTMTTNIDSFVRTTIEYAKN